MFLEGIPLAISFNQSTAIPIVVTQQTSWTQFSATMILTGIFALYFIFGIFKTNGAMILAKIYLYFFKRKNKSKNIIVIKHTKNELFDTSMINRKTLERIQEALMKFRGQDFDLILYTPGGEVFAAQYISRLLNNYKGKIRTFIPIFSMSGGTYLALSTDEIYMNDYSCLGAIDPQLGTLFGIGSAKGWNEVVRIKKNKANDQSIIMNLMGKQYTRSIKDAITDLIKDKVPIDKRKYLVELLTSGNIEHGFPLTKPLLKSYGLKINDISDETNNKIIRLIRFMPEGVIST